MIKENKIDVMLNIAKTANREKYLSFALCLIQNLLTQYLQKKMKTRSKTG